MHRDQVNAYGGLGKVGLDYNPKGEEGEVLIPLFSSSAMKWAKKEEPEEVEEFLAEELEGAL